MYFFYSETVKTVSEKGAESEHFSIIDSKGLTPISRTNHSYHIEILFLNKISFAVYFALVGVMT